MLESPGLAAVATAMLWQDASPRCRRFRIFVPFRAACEVNWDYTRVQMSQTKPDVIEIVSQLALSLASLNAKSGTIVKTL